MLDGASWTELSDSEDRMSIGRLVADMWTSKKRTRFDALSAILGPLCNISIFRAQSSYRVVCGYVNFNVICATNEHHICNQHLK